jgi:integrase
MAYAKSNHVPETITVQSDKGSLRLQFSTKYNPIFGGKRKHQGLAMKDTPENWQKAVAIAWRIEEDLQHADWQILFDPTFAKYGLKTKYAAELKLAAPVPQSEPEMTVGEMWEDYLVWKESRLQPTVFKLVFCSTFTNILKGLAWNKKTLTLDFVHTNVWSENLSSSLASVILAHPVSARSRFKLLAALSEAFIRLQSLGKTRITANPFVIVDGTVENKTDKYKPTVNVDGEIQEWWESEASDDDPEERDRRGFTESERDTIIKAFYESDKANKRQAAPLIEFLFLTGCRPGEAFALTWQDVFIGQGKNYIRFSKSYNGTLKNTQVTKTGGIRLFKIYPKLNELLLIFKPTDAKPTDCVFVQLNTKRYNTRGLGAIWHGNNRKLKGGSYFVPGVVTQLVETNAISCYLSPYHTRHTFITLQAHAGANLLLLASCCGNSIEMIQKHYLGVDTTVDLLNI